MGALGASSGALLGGLLTETFGWRAQSGVASGLLNASQLMGGALGLAILSTVASGKTGGEAAVGAVRALTDGFDLAFTVAPPDLQRGHAGARPS